MYYDNTSRLKVEDPISMTICIALAGRFHGFKDFRCKGNMGSESTVPGMGDQA